MKEKRLKPTFVRKLKKSWKDVKEGRYYIYACSHVKGLNVCNECHVKECKRWYKIGRRDGIKCARAL